MKADFQKTGIHIWIRQTIEDLELISVAKNHFPDLPESKGNHQSLKHILLLFLTHLESRHWSLKHKN